MFFDVRLVSVSDKLHVDFTIALLVLFAGLEGLVLLKVIKVLVGNIRLDPGDIRGFPLPHTVPVKTMEKGVILDFV